MSRKRRRMATGLCRKCGLPVLCALVLYVLYGHRLRQLVVGALLNWNAVEVPTDGEIAASFQNMTTAAADCMCAEPGAGVRHSLCYVLNATVRGERFSCGSVHALRELGLLQTEFRKEYDDEDDALQITDPPIVTAVSDDHYAEVRMMVRSAQDTFPSADIVVHDLGLGAANLEELGRFCRVTVRPFNFSAYPPSVRSLYTYRWKPILLASALYEFPSGFWWADSSVRWKSNDVQYLYKAVAQTSRSPYLLVDYTGHSVYAATNPLMYKYLPSDVRKLKRVAMHGGGFVFAVRNRISVDVLKWLTLCALESDCMSPPRSSLSCRFGANRWRAYAHCHRYDQSAVNVILANKFMHTAAAYTTGEQRFATVQRGHVEGEPPKSCR